MIFTQQKKFKTKSILLFLPPLNGEESKETGGIISLKVTSASEKNAWTDFPVIYTKENLHSR